MNRSAARASAAGAASCSSPQNRPSASRSPASSVLTTMPGLRRVASRVSAESRCVFPAPAAPCRYSGLQARFVRDEQTHPNTSRTAASAGRTSGTPTRVAKVSASGLGMECSACWGSGGKGSTPRAAEARSRGRNQTALRVETWSNYTDEHAERKGDRWIRKHFMEKDLGATWPPGGVGRFRRLAKPQAMPLRLRFRKQGKGSWPANEWPISPGPTSHTMEGDYNT